MRNFARNWILDLKDRHIRINAVRPGVTDTAGLNELFGNGESAENTKNYLAGLIPAGRIGKPEEVAKPAGVLLPLAQMRRYAVIEPWPLLCTPRRCSPNLLRLEGM